jgi:hypothetical protein
MFYYTLYQQFKFIVTHCSLQCLGFSLSHDLEYFLSYRAFFRIQTSIDAKVAQECRYCNHYAYQAHIFVKHAVLGHPTLAVRDAGSPIQHKLNNDPPPFAANVVIALLLGSKCLRRIVDTCSSFSVVFAGN